MESTRFLLSFFIIYHYKCIQPLSKDVINWLINQVIQKVPNIHLNSIWIDNAFPTNYEYKAYRMTLSSMIIMCLWPSSVTKVDWDNDCYPNTWLKINYNTLNKFSHKQHLDRDFKEQQTNGSFVPMMPLPLTLTSPMHFYDFFHLIWSK